MCYNIYDDRIDVGIAYDSDDSNLTFKWEAYNLDKQKWNLVADWTGSNWVSWYPKKVITGCMLQHGHQMV